MGQLEKLQSDISTLLQIVAKINKPATAIHITERLYERRAAAEFLKVSLSTLDRMTREGVVKCYRVGDTDQKRYKYTELLEALIPIEVGEMAG